ncbi:hypothetical protein C0J45_8100 [Silurus meridionalis]|nr:hypothetical protein C0J45_8100 [Silurus meridionalis]
MMAVFQFGVLLLLLGCVQGLEQIFNDNSLVIETYGRDVQDKIDTALNKVCQPLKVIKAPCKSFIKKYKGKLVKAIMSAKNAPAACKQLTLCKKTSIYSP